SVPAIGRRVLQKPHKKWPGALASQGYRGAAHWHGTGWRGRAGRFASCRVVYYCPGSSQQCNLRHAQSRGRSRRCHADFVPGGHCFHLGAIFRGERAVILWNMWEATGMSAPETIDVADAASLPRHATKVLLVDDQAIIGEAIRRMLAPEKDIVFQYCNDPTAALQVANKFAPTVILQDLVMPDIDGLMLVRFFRANAATRDIPLIVLSTKEEPKIKAEAFAL